MGALRPWGTLLALATAFATSCPVTGYAPAELTADARKQLPHTTKWPLRLRPQPLRGGTAAPATAISAGAVHKPDNWGSSSDTDSGESCWDGSGGGAPEGPVLPAPSAQTCSKCFGTGVMSASGAATQHGTESAESRARAAELRAKGLERKLRQLEEQFCQAEAELVQSRAAAAVVFSCVCVCVCVCVCNVTAHVHGSNAHTHTHTCIYILDVYIFVYMYMYAHGIVVLVVVAVVLLQ
jgi:hypothetical protein